MQRYVGSGKEEEEKLIGERRKSSGDPSQFHFGLLMARAAFGKGTPSWYFMSYNSTTDSFFQLPVIQVISPTAGPVRAK